MNKTVFVTGGAGYIGSHCIVELLNAGYKVVAVDNFVNSVGEENGDSAALKRVETITGKRISFHQMDLLDIKELDNLFEKVSMSTAVRDIISGGIFLFVATNRLCYTLCCHEGCRRVDGISTALLQKQHHRHAKFARSKRVYLFSVFAYSSVRPGSYFR